MTLAAVSVILLVCSIFAIVYPFIFNTTQGEIEVHQSPPVGIQINNLADGDRLELEYNADRPVEVYFIRRSLADEYRSPRMDKEPLPEPVYTGSEGKLTLHVQYKGDHEIFFLPDIERSVSEDPEGNIVSMVIIIEYSLERSVRREIIGFTIYGASLMILSLGSGAASIFGYRRSRTKIDDR